MIARPGDFTSDLGSKFHRSKNDPSGNIGFCSGRVVQKFDGVKFWEGGQRVPSGVCVVTLSPGRGGSPAPGRASPRWGKGYSPSRRAGGSEAALVSKNKKKFFLFFLQTQSWNSPGKRNRRRPGGARSNIENGDSKSTAKGVPQFIVPMTPPDNMGTRSARGRA